MSTIGNISLPFDPSRSSGKPRDAQRFNGDGATLTFTLSLAVDSAVDIDVYVDNISQEPLTAYDVNGASITFTEAPPVGTNNVRVIYRNYQTGISTSVADGSISYQKLANNIRVFTTDNFTGDNTTVAFALTTEPADANTVFVSVDGIVQRAPIHYTTSGTTITFTSAPPTSSNVHIRHLGFRTTSTVTALSANTTITQPVLASPSFTGTVQTGAAFTGNLSATGTLGVTGAATLSSTLGVTGAATLSSTLGVTGAATLSSTLAVTGAGDFGTTLQGRTITSLGAHTSGSFNAFIAKNSTAGTTFSGKFLFQDGNGNNGWSISNNQLVGSGFLEFNDGATNRAYFSTGGAFLLNGGVSGFSATNTKLQVLGTAQDWTVAIGNNNATSAYGIYIVYSACTPNDSTTSFFLQGVDSSATRFKMLSNGGLSNFSGNNVNLSDLDVKPFTQAFDAEKLWRFGKAMRPAWIQFKYDDQTHDDWNNGYGAQLVQEAAGTDFPELVSLGNWGTKDEPKMRLEVYDNDLIHIMCAITTESQFKIDALIAKNEALEARLAALEAK